MKMKFLAAAALCLCALPLMGQTLSCDEFCHKARYAEANKTVTARPLAVLFGDSITDGWAQKDPAFFAENNLVGRGISGETTSQMLLRFRDDVVALRPRYVVILAGINDIALNQGYSTLDGTVGNIISMCEIALANGIRPVLCSPTPASSIPWRSEVSNVADKVDQLGFMLKAYASRKGLAYVDYWTPLHGEDRGFPAKWAPDGIHPNPEGYKIMENLVMKALR